LTVRELYREFTAARLRRHDEMEALTFGAYQTVRVEVMTKNKKRMPDFKTLIAKSDGGDQTTGQMRATMQQLAQQYGSKRMRVNTRTHGE
jgi:hypothetical protein